MTWRPGTAKALARSFDIYFRDQDRTARMDALNATHVRTGNLVFDVGAHVGDRTASFRRLGAHVVTVEPQAQMFRALRLLFGNDPNVHLHQGAVGAAPGQTTFYVNSANPTTSTAAREMVEAAPHADAWSDQVWDTEVTVDITTLDQLIAQHGQPDFIKIDVEGFEADVLRGLTHPVATLSFEFTTLQRDVAVKALQVASDLGRYRFNYSLGETHVMGLEAPVSATEMAEIVSSLPTEANSGDIYAYLDVD